MEGNCHAVETTGRIYFDNISEEEEIRKIPFKEKKILHKSSVKLISGVEFSVSAILTGI